METDNTTTKGACCRLVGHGSHFQRPFKCPMCLTSRAGITGIVIIGVLVCLGCCNKLPHTGWLKQQKFIVPQFWRPNSETQVSAGLVSSEAMRERSVPGLSPGLADGRLLPVYSHHLPSVCFCVQISPSYGDTSHIGLVPP